MRSCDPMSQLGNYKPNPHYGNGIFRRAIRLTRHPDHVLAELEDSHHGFRVRVFHEAQRLTRFEPEYPRVPFSSCDSAGTVLDRLLGMPVDTPVAELIATANPLANCTHLLDLTLLAIAHTQREEQVVLYEVAVTDARDGLSHLRVWRNGTLMHEWQAGNGIDGTIASPSAYQGKPLFMGFSRWANEAFSGLENEAAFVLQKGNMVALGNMFDIAGMAGGRAIDETDRHACHTYSPTQAPHAIRLANTWRDFTETPETLLKFV